MRYPGLVGHPQHARARDLFGGRYGQILSFAFKDGIDAAARLDGLRTVVLATHLWDTRTLAIPVAHTIFSELGEAGRAAAGIDEGLIRISVGLEAPADLIADFDHAFEGAAR